MITVPSGGARYSPALVGVGGLPVGVQLSDGTCWLYQQLDGWHQPPAVRDRIEERPGADGGFPATALKSPRVITIGGMITGTRSKVLAGLRTLGALSGEVLVEVDDPNRGYLWCSAEVLDQQNDGIHAAFGYGRFQVQFRASDPRLYGLQQTVTIGLRNPGAGGLTYPLAYPLDYGTAPSGGRVVLVNTGTAPTEPRITVTGPLTDGFIVSHAETGRSLSYYAATSALNLDCYGGTATEGGQDRTRYLLNREWFQVPPGASATFAFATFGTETSASVPAPQMIVAMSPAYW